MTIKPVSLYIHIPFCAQKCGYCDFNSYAGSQPAEQERYLRALMQEMELWAVRPELKGVPIPTIFVGGGTPTAVEGPLLAELLHTACSLFAVEPDAEVTVEANPGTIDIADDKLQLAFAAGANRISFGVQAYQQHLLSRLGRIHSAAQVEDAVKAAREAGFANINLDLMYGLPGQSAADFHDTVAWALSLGPTHVSLYSLIVEEGTPFYADFTAGRLKLPPDDVEESMLAAGSELLAAEGLGQYEVSNFAFPGMECRHNQVYWRNEPYLGLGCGAHSFLPLQAFVPNLGARLPRLTASRVQGGAAVSVTEGSPGDQYRFWNLRTPVDYCRAMDGSGQLPVEAGEVIDLTGEMAETMMVGLRQVEGVAESRFTARFGCTLAEVYGPVIARLEAMGLLVKQDGHIRLTPRGMRLGNRVWQEFLP